MEKNSNFKTITFNNSVINFDRVVAYGCSHTAGTELADHLFWHEPISVIELDKIKRSYPNSNPFYKKYVNLGEYYVLEAQRRLSWAGQVASRLGVPILNRGISGSSMQGMIYSIEKDLHDNVITDHDLVLIGATSADRWMYFKKQDRVEWPNIATPILGYPHLWPNDKFHNMFVEEIADDYFTYYNYFNSLKYLDLLSSRYNNRFLIQFIHHTMDDYIDIVSHKSLNRKFIELVSKTNTFKSIIDHNICFGKLVDWNDKSHLHGFCHPHVRYHEQLADLIVSKLLKNE